MSVEARLEWIEKRFNIVGLEDSLEQLDGELEVAEQTVSTELHRLRGLEDQLSDREADLAYLAETDPDLKNKEQRKASLLKQLKEDSVWLTFRAQVRDQKRVLDDKRAAVNALSNRQKNLRALAELRAAQMKLLSR